MVRSTLQVRPLLPIPTRSVSDPSIEPDVKTLLAQHPKSQPGHGTALLGQKLLQARGRSW